MDYEPIYLMKDKEKKVEFFADVDVEQNPNFVIYLPKGTNEFITKKSVKNQTDNFYFEFQEKKDEKCKTKSKIIFNIEKISRKKDKCDADNLFNIFYIINKYFLENFKINIRNFSNKDLAIIQNTELHNKLKKGGFSISDECLYKIILDKIHNIDADFFDKNIYFYLGNVNYNYFYYVRLNFSKKLYLTTQIKITQIVRISLRVLQYMQSILTQYANSLKEQNLKDRILRIFFQDLKLNSYNSKMSFSKKNNFPCEISE